MTFDHSFIFNDLEHPKLLIQIEGSRIVPYQTPQRSKPGPFTGVINMTNAEPTAILSHLHRADGSATFSQNGYTVIGAVNGPIEVQRRDELPEEAAIDVIVRPATGVGGN